VFHTDRGIEYAAGAFKERIAELGFTQSMNRPGKVTDNAFIESFFHSMKSVSVDVRLHKTVHAYPNAAHSGWDCCVWRTNWPPSGLAQFSRATPTWSTRER
jgi:transposase InsO family protein